MRDFGLTDKSGMGSSPDQGPNRTTNPADPKGPFQTADASSLQELLIRLTDLSERNGTFGKNSDRAVDGGIAQRHVAEFYRGSRAVSEWSKTACVDRRASVASGDACSIRCHQHQRSEVGFSTYLKSHPVRRLIELERPQAQAWFGLLRASRSGNHVRRRCRPCAGRGPRSKVRRHQMQAAVAPEIFGGLNHACVF